MPLLNWTVRLIPKLVHGVVTSCSTSTPNFQFPSWFKQCSKGNSLPTMFWRDGSMELSSRCKRSSMFVPNPWFDHRTSNQWKMNHQNEELIWIWRTNTKNHYAWIRDSGQWCPIFVLQTKNCTTEENILVLLVSWPTICHVLFLYKIEP